VVVREARTERLGAQRLRGRGDVVDREGHRDLTFPNYASPVTIAEEISRSRYVSLTTYRKDGTAVATPVWAVADGGDLLVVSEAQAGKVKRIRRDSRVQVTACDIRGRVAPGAPTAAATARLLDEEGTQAARKLLARKYFLSWLGNGLARLLRLRRPPVIGIAVTF
jgi:hypothetical protein